MAKSEQKTTPPRRGFKRGGAASGASPIGMRVVVGIGLLLGVSGSGLTLRRFLRV